MKLRELSGKKRGKDLIIEACNRCDPRLPKYYGGQVYLITVRANNRG